MTRRNKITNCHVFPFFKGKFLLKIYHFTPRKREGEKKEDRREGGVRMNQG